METRQRTLLKAAIWILLGWLTMTIVGFLFTGSFTAGGAMAALNSVIGFVCYVIYERFWSRLDWGRHG